MKATYNDHVGRFETIQDAVWKALQYGSTNVTMHNWEAFRMVCNYPRHPVYRLQKLVSQPFTLSLVLPIR